MCSLHSAFFKLFCIKSRVCCTFILFIDDQMSGKRTMLPKETAQFNSHYEVLADPKNDRIVFILFKWLNNTIYVEQRLEHFTIR